MRAGVSVSSARMFSRCGAYQLTLRPTLAGTFGVVGHVDLMRRLVSVEPVCKLAGRGLNVCCVE
jgi:hypothetical protein